MVRQPDAIVRSVEYMASRIHGSGFNLQYDRLSMPLPDFLGGFPIGRQVNMVSARRVKPLAQNGFKKPGRGAMV